MMSFPKDQTNAAQTKERERERGEVAKKNLAQWRYDPSDVNLEKLLSGAATKPSVRWIHESELENESSTPTRMRPVRKAAFHGSYANPDDMKSKWDRLATSPTPEYFWVDTIPGSSIRRATQRTLKDEERASTASARRMSDILDELKCGTDDDKNGNIAEEQEGQSEDEADSNDDDDSDASLLAAIQPIIFENGKSVQ